MSDFENDLRKQLAREADTVQHTPRDLSMRIATATGPRPATWLRLAPVAVALLMLAAGTTAYLAAQQRGGGHGGPAPVAGGGASPAVAATISPSAVPTALPATSHPVVCGPGGSGGSQAATGNLAAVRVAHQVGFDRVTFEFAGAGVPQYTVTMQDSPRFTQDASGALITLKGSRGIKVVFHGASERDTAGNQTYQGSNDISLAPAPGSANTVAEVRQVGDFERVLSWGIGVSAGNDCTHISELSSPSRLVVDVMPLP